MNPRPRSPLSYNFRTYESGGVMAVIKGRGNAETKIEHFEVVKAKKIVTRAGVNS